MLVDILRVLRGEGGGVGQQAGEQDQLGAAAGHHLDPPARLLIITSLVVFQKTVCLYVFPPLPVLD
jgi:hypothetical protein